MTPLQELIDQIPERHNLVSYLVFSGVVMGLILAAVVGMRAPASNRGLTYFALLMGSLSIVILDTWLCYTGWMKYTLHWNDSTEPLTLLLAPLLYLCVRFLLLRRPLPPWVLLLHFLPALLYALSQVGYYTEPLAIKFNAYKDAYFPEIPFAEVPETTTYGYQGFKDLHRWFILLSFSFYGLLSLMLWRKHRREGFGKPSSGIRISKYQFGTFLIGSLFVVLGILLAVYLSYEDDGGDHLLSLLVFATAGIGTIALMSESRFFQRAWLIDKYETQASGRQDPSLEEVKTLVSDPAFFAAPEASLKLLAERMGTHPNTVSRLINQNTGGNFNDFINAYRIELAKKRLASENYRHLTVEAIGQSVGFRSKSAFYQAFRKKTGLSPSRFAKGKPSGN